MMNDEWVLINREALLSELQRVFDAHTAEVLLRILNKVAAQVRTAGVTREDFNGLRQILVELIAAQVRTDEQVRELAAAQRQTEEQVRELAAAQRHTDEQVRELAAVQRQTSVAVAELTEGIDRLRKQVGGLSESLGGDIEDIAYIVLHDVLKREFGWKVGVLERSWQTWDEEPEEVNVFGVATDPARPEKTIWIVGEAKHNLSMKEVQKFIGQVERARRHLAGEVFPVCFCYRARPEVQQMVRKASIRLVFSYGKLV